MADINEPRKSLRIFSALGRVLDAVLPLPDSLHQGRSAVQQDQDNSEQARCNSISGGRGQPPTEVFFPQPPSHTIASSTHLASPPPYEALMQRDYTVASQSPSSQYDLNNQIDGFPQQTFHVQNAPNASASNANYVRISLLVQSNEAWRLSDSPGLRRLLFSVLWYSDTVRWAFTTVTKGMPESLHDEHNCCEWSAAEVCDRSLEWNLLCPCFLVGNLTARFGVGLIGGMIYAMSMLIAHCIHLPIAFILFLKHIVFRSPQFDIMMKIFLLAWGGIGLAISIPVIFVTSMLYSLIIVHGWGISNAVFVMSKSVYIMITQSSTHNAEVLRGYEQPGPYLRLRIFPALLAFTYMFVGMGVCSIGFFVKAILQYPFVMLQSVSDIWRDAFKGIKPSKSGPDHAFSDYSIFRCTHCVEETMTQCCALFMLPLRLVASIIVICVLVLVPFFAFFIGLFAGLPAGEMLT
eukprot:gene1788-4898_t